MEFPVSIAFIAGVGSPRLLLTDAAGKVCGCMAGVSGYQKCIVYDDQAQTTPLYAIEWKYGENNYHFSTARGERLGASKRTPRGSIWRLHYVVEVGDAPALEITEENPWVKVADELAGFLPLVGRFTGLFLNPTYAVARPGEAPILRLIKDRSVQEYHFSVHQAGPIEPREREVAILALLMFVMRENWRG